MNPFQSLMYLLSQYEIACKAKDAIRAYQIAIDISDIALQLEEFAQRLANENHT